MRYHRAPLSAPKMKLQLCFSRMQLQWILLQQHLQRIYFHRQRQLRRIRARRQQPRQPWPRAALITGFFCIVILFMLFSAKADYQQRHDGHALAIQESYCLAVAQDLYKLSALNHAAISSANQSTRGIPVKSAFLTARMNALSLALTQCQPDKESSLVFTNKMQSITNDAAEDEYLQKTSIPAFNTEDIYLLGNSPHGAAGDATWSDPIETFFWNSDEYGHALILMMVALLYSILLICLASIALWLLENHFFGNKVINDLIGTIKSNISRDDKSSAAARILAPLVMISPWVMGSALTLYSIPAPYPASHNYDPAQPAPPAFINNPVTLPVRIESELTLNPHMDPLSINASSTAQINTRLDVQIPSQSIALIASAVAHLQLPAPQITITIPEMKTDIGATLHKMHGTQQEMLTATQVMNQNLENIATDGRTRVGTCETLRLQARLISGQEPLNDPCNTDH